MELTFSTQVEIDLSATIHPESFALGDFVAVRLRVNTWGVASGPLEGTLGWVQH